MADLLEADGTLTALTPEARAAFLCGPYMGLLNLNVGCGRHPLRGRWTDLDRVGGEGADLVCTLGIDPIQLPDNSVSCVFASHVLEHIPDIISAMREIHRVLEPGGVLVACTPYASSDGAWDDPTHVRAFTATSWGFYDKRLYATPDQAGFYPSPVDYIFEVLKVDLVPEPEYIMAVREGRLTEADLKDKLRRERNVIQEIQAHLLAVKE